MGVYARGKRLWASWMDDGQQRGPLLRADETPLLVGQEAEAERIFAAMMRGLATARRRAAEAEQGGGPLTVRRKQAAWTADRIKRNVSSAVDDTARFLHAFDIKVGEPPTPFGDIVFTEVRASHVRRVVRELRKRVGPGPDDMAPRSVRNVYSVLQAMFRDAVADEEIPASPCVLQKGELPAKEDKDPSWRIDAVFTRAELEQLISDERIESWHRLIYAMQFLTGMRIGEAGARRWADYDATVEPLGRLVVKTSYSHRHKREKPPKTGVAREVPIHPTLAKLLAAWKLSGWQEMHGRAPTPEDRILPAAEGGYLASTRVLKMLHADLKTLGLRRRRTHDARATFISLGTADGASEPLLKRVTHLTKKDAYDLYKRGLFGAMSAEVAKIRVRLLDGKLLELRAAAGASYHTVITANGMNEKGPELQPVRSPGNTRGTGLENVRAPSSSVFVHRDVSDCGDVAASRATISDEASIDCDTAITVAALREAIRAVEHKLITTAVRRKFLSAAEAALYDLEVGGGGR